MSERTRDDREKAIELWALAASPSVWAVHFLLSYATVAIWCAKVAGPGGPLGAARAAVAVYTVIALAAIAAIGLRGWRRHRDGGSAPHDDDTPEDRRRFLGFATALLSALSAIATGYGALSAAFIGSCR